MSSRSQDAVGIPSLGWPTLPGLSSTRRPSNVSREPAPGLIVWSCPSSSTYAIGTWVWPWSPLVVGIAAMPARATGVVVTYSQVGSRGLPWTRSVSSRSSRSGRASSQARVSGPIVACVHSIARRASTLKASMSSRPTAAASWFPRTPSAPIERNRATTASGSGPYPTTSPSCQTSSTDGIAASTASRAAALAWMSERTATRTARG